MQNNVLGNSINITWKRVSRSTIHDAVFQPLDAFTFDQPLMRLQFLSVSTKFRLIETMFSVNVENLFKRYC